MIQTLELGLDTFGDVTDGSDGKPLQAAQVIRNLVEEAVLADEVGVDFIGSASITVPISPSRHRKWCWRQSQAAPGASGLARR